MGWFGLFYFVLKCIKLLAWPTFALGYPLCASVQAIETNSNDHMRKMVTYWILFSFICLFEHTFGGLIQWLPVWPNAKILVIFWLVIPRFNGARIAYNILVRPCLSGQLLRVVLDLLNKNQYLSLEGEPFLIVPQRYVNKHGTEYLEELNFIKPKTVKPAYSQDAIKAVEILNGSEAAAEDKPKNIEPTFSQDDSKAVEILNESGAPAVNKITTKLNAHAKVKDMTLPSPLEENVQREWTCAVCQVTTSSETTLNLHLQGRKHRTKCEELKAEKQCKLQQKNIEPTFSQDDSKAVEILNESGAPAVNKPKNIESTFSQDHSKAGEILNESGAPAVNKITTKLNAYAKVKDMTLPSPLEENVQREWPCAMCQVTTSSEKTLNLHLQGRKHRAKCEELKAEKQWKLQQKNIEPTFSQDDSKAVEILNESGAPAVKKPKNIEPTFSQDHSKAGEILNESGAPAVNKPKVIEPKSSHDDIKTVEILTGSAAAADNKTTTKPNACVDVKILTLPAPLEEDVQREWTCAVCQVTTMSEATLKLHLQGRKHRTKCEELKARKQTTKKGVIIGGPNRERCCTICQVKSQTEATWNSHVQGKKHKSKCKELKAIVKAAKNKNFSSTATKSYQANQDPEKASSDGGPSYKFSCADTDPKKTSFDGRLNNRFGCDICQMTLQSEATLKSHLHGKNTNPNLNRSKRDDRGICILSCLNKESFAVSGAKESFTTTVVVSAQEARLFFKLIS